MILVNYTLKEPIFRTGLQKKFYNQSGNDEITAENTLKDKKEMKSNGVNPGQAYWF